ncbi:MAG: phosphate ABC transporter permease family protein, partial [Pseudomonadota bacterium]|nr:phosphate ABC transporter permease family protein [Pseudomonadota bacterium]
MIYISLLLVFLVSYSFYFIGKKRALNITTQRKQTLSALPDYYGYYAVIVIIIPAVLIWFFLLIFKSYFQEIYVMSPLLFPDIDMWSESKTGLIMNKITNLSYIVNLPDIDLSVGDKSILKMASDSELIAAKNLASFDKIYGW